MGDIHDLTLPSHVELPEEEVDIADIPPIATLTADELTAAYMALVQMLAEAFGPTFPAAVVENAHEILSIMEQQRAEGADTEGGEG